MNWSKLSNPHEVEGEHSIDPKDVLCEECYEAQRELFPVGEVINMKILQETICKMCWENFLFEFRSYCDRIHNVEEKSH